MDHEFPQYYFCLLTSDCLMLWSVALLEHIERKHLLFLAHFSCLRKERRQKTKKTFLETL